MTYRETLDFLFDSLPVFQHVGGSAYKEGLDNIIALDRHLGSPAQKVKNVHVAGTNGKGSVSHMTAAVLAASGLKTGLFTSPHLKDFRERIRIDGRVIPEEAVVDFVERNKAFIDKLKPSFFEATTAMAFDYFASQNVDIAVIEAGMGGRLDSTNIINPLVSVITNIGLDHTRFLGETLSEIAREKAGIIKPDTPVVIGESDIETRFVFIDTAREHSAPLLFADQCYITTGSEACTQGQLFHIRNLMEEFDFDLACDLAGLYQRKNIATVLTLLDVLNGAGGIPIPQDAVRRGIATAASSTGLSGRWQKLGEHPLVICDTGHNPDGIKEITAQIKLQKFRKLYMIIGLAADKDLDKILPLLPHDAYYIFTQANIPRALDRHELAQHARKYNLRGETTLSVHSALEKALSLATPDDMIFVGGSTFITAEVL